MHLEPYDSPTFLTQKDKYMFGLSLPELMIALGVAGLWFLVLLVLPIGAMFRIVLVVPTTGVTLMILFVKVSGLSIPNFIVLSIVRMFKRPVFEESREMLIGGESSWLELQRQRSAGRSRFSFLRRGRNMVAIPESRQVELKADIDRQVTEGAVAAERMARDAIRTFVKGH